MVTILINGKAGSVEGPGLRRQLEDRLLQALPGCRVIFTGNGTDARAEAQRAVDAGADMVVGGGGDGTLSAIAAVLAGTDTSLGILPLGTLNHFARDLGIPLDLDGAIATLAAGRVTRIDVGEVNGSLFLNNSGLGLYPAIVSLRQQRQSMGFSKWPSAIWATMKAFSRYERLSLRVVVEGRELRRRTPVVFVGNNEYSLEGFQASMRNRLDDGQLSVYIPHAHGRLRLIWFSFRALFVKPRPSEDFDAFLTRECRIDSRHHVLRISLDGEVTSLYPPLHYQTRPQSLRVVLPAPPA